MIRFDVRTIFPELFPGPLAVGVIGRAIAAGDVELDIQDLRAHTEGRHRQVDDEPFGGGAGMVFKPEPLIRAVRAMRAAEPALSPLRTKPRIWGRPLNSAVVPMSCARRSAMRFSKPAR